MELFNEHVHPEYFEWLLLLVRWLHITVAVTWIGTSIFFMWLDRTISNGEVWMVHGGGFYRVQKLAMGSVKVPDILHWFKWESYWTWMSGVALLALMFYSGEGALLLDPAKPTTYWQAVGLSVSSIVVSWFFYDFVWELKLVRDIEWLGHALTLAWVLGMALMFCHFLGGRAAYMHLGAVLGTWMSGNVYLRIIPRQVLMVEAARSSVTVNAYWAKNAKSRSTHNTYFTLPIIFIMISNHFPSTYGHSMNWLIVLVMGAAGAAIRHYFVTRLSDPIKAKGFLVGGIALLLGIIYFTKDSL